MKNAAQASKKILILEDDEDIVEILTEWLTSLDYEITARTTVDDVIRLAKETQPDLVLLDYLLGGINGGEYCHELKMHPATKHIPVIMLSAHQRVIESLGNYGWDAFVAKPFDLEQLAVRISTLLEKNKK